MTTHPGPADTGLRYRDHIELLTALVTYLALTKRISRSAKGLARDLSLERSEVEAVLDGFPGIFRRSKTMIEVDDDPRFTYTLHSRYALRGTADPDAGDGSSEGPALQAEYLRMTLDLISDRAAGEQTVVRDRNALVVAAIAAVVAAGSVVAQLVSG